MPGRRPHPLGRRDRPEHRARLAHGGRERGQPGGAARLRTLTERRAGFDRISRALGRLGDDDVRELAGSVGSGRIGGASGVVEVDGERLFLKCLPLTAPELALSEGSTADPFGLPAFCHYGIGSPGYGAWRELAMLRATTDAVLGERARAFPLTYHHRVLTGVTVPVPDELRDADAVAAFWDGSEAVRERVLALHSATAVVAAFQEWHPRNALEWLTERAAAGEAAADEALWLVTVRLAAAVRRVRAQGWMHLDAHLENVLVDGRELYLTDWGLGLSRDFDLSADERRFVDTHASYDASYVAYQLVRWVLVTWCPDADRDEVVAAAVAGRLPPDLPPHAGDVLRRYAPVAAVVLPFYRELQTSRRAVYPDGAARDALADLPA